MSNRDDDPINPFSEYQRHTLLGAAKLLAVSQSTIVRLRDSGRLGPWSQFGRRWYIKGSDIKRFIDGDDNLPVAAE